jgi:hypothetical protein
MPEIANWLAAASPSGSQLSEYVAEEVGLTGTVAVAGFLWPTLIRVDDCILLSDQYDESAYREFRDRLDRRGDIEATINHVHLWDIFTDEAADPAALVYVGQLMSRTWLAAAREAFPDDEMVTKYSNDPDLDYGPTLTLRSAR